jgi:hypothetical protein
VWYEWVYGSAARSSRVRGKPDKGIDSILDGESEDRVDDELDNGWDDESDWRLDCGVDNGLENESDQRLDHGVDDDMNDRPNDGSKDKVLSVDAGLDSKGDGNVLAECETVCSLFFTRTMALFTTSSSELIRIS